jgi:hypothetical protein
LKAAAAEIGIKIADGNNVIARAVEKLEPGECAPH